MPSLGIFGGTFDPVHVGHLALLRVAQEKLAIDTVLVCPAGVPPMRQDAPQASIQHRINMLDIALSGVNSVEVSDLDAHPEETSYTVNLIDRVRHKYSGRRLKLLLGADAAKNISQWKRADQIKEYCDVIVIDRVGYTHFTGSIGNSGEEISSTMIRRKIKLGKPFATWLPQGVHRYIRDNDLYR